MKALLLTALALLPAAAAPAASVHMIELQGTINPGSADFILEALREAEEAKAEAFVLRLNTPGGLLASTRSIIQGISESSVPVITWVSPGGASATSAGALIALASHVAVMAPGTNIGAAHPVGGQGEDIKGDMGKKATNDTAALARAQAELRGRNVATAEAVVTQSKSFAAEEAVKAGVADFVAADFASLMKQASGRKVIVENPRRELKLDLSDAAETSAHRREMNTRQRFLHFVADPNVSALLLTLGGLAAWAEASSGFSAIVPGIVAILCFVLAFVSLQTLPINVGGALLMVLGFALLAAEAFVTSYGLLSISALALIYLGGLFLIDPAAGSMQVSQGLLASVTVALGLVVIGVGFLISRDKRSTGTDTFAGTSVQVATVEPGGLSGTAILEGEIWRFESKEAVQAGETCLVRRAHGLKIEIEKRRT